MKRLLSKKKDKKESKEKPLHKPAVVDVHVASSGMTRKERNVLDSNMPRLEKILNAKNVLKHLRRTGEVGAQEEEAILKAKSGKASKGEQVSTLVDYLKQRPGGFTILLTALLQSKSQEHVATELLKDANFTGAEVNELLEKVEKNLDNTQIRKLQKFREENLSHQGAPKPPTPNDSLLSESGSEYSVPSSSSYGGAGSLRQGDSGYVFSDRQASADGRPAGRGEQEPQLLDNMIVHTLSRQTDLDEAVKAGWTEVHEPKDEHEQEKEEMGLSVQREKGDGPHPKETPRNLTTEDHVPSANDLAPNDDDDAAKADGVIPIVSNAEVPVIEPDTIHEEEEASSDGFENGEQIEVKTNQMEKKEEDQVPLLEGRAKHQSLGQLSAEFDARASKLPVTNKSPMNREATVLVSEGNAPEAPFTRRNTFPRIKSTGSSPAARGLADIKVRAALESIKELRESTLRLRENLQKEHYRLDQLRRDARKMLTAEI